MFITFAEEITATTKCTFHTRKLLKFVAASEKAGKCKLLHREFFINQYTLLNVKEKIIHKTL